MAAEIATTIDMHIVWGGLEKMVDHAELELATNVKTHRPVALVFHEAPLQLRMREQRKPQKLNTQRVFGPQPPAPLWTLPKRLVEEGFEAVANGNKGQAVVLLDDSFSKFADIAEQAIISMTMTEVKKKGQRGKPAKTAWAPLFKKNNARTFEVNEQLTNMIALICE